jgi:CBS-domain-containing membrane protein
MANLKYPNITDAMLIPFRAIEVQLDTAPDLLDRPECPYPAHVKALLKRLLGGSDPPPKERKEFSNEDLELEIQDLYEELRNTTIKGEAKEQIALVKTRADLLTRMVGLKERALNARDMARFQRTVITTIDAHLTPAQRSEFLEQLGQNVR